MNSNYLTRFIFSKTKSTDILNRSGTEQDLEDRHVLFMEHGGGRMSEEDVREDERVDSLGNWKDHRTLKSIEITFT